MHILLFFLPLLQADLPIHCERGDYTGRWRFRLIGHPQRFPLDFSSGAKYCSATLGRPTQNSDLMKQINPLTQELITPDSQTETMEILLTSSQEIHPEIESFARHRLLAISASPPAFPGDAPVRGFWSPTFDQGFEVRIGGKSFLAISRYSCADSESSCLDDNRAHEDAQGQVNGWKGDCGKTFVGWWHSPGPNDPMIDSYDKQYATNVTTTFDTASNTNGDQPTFGGCFIGEKITELPNNLRGQRVALSFAQVGTRSGDSAVRGLPTAGDSCNIDAAVEDEEAYKSLPQNFDWRKHFPEITNVEILEQGNCGSCYAVAAVYALEMRTNIALARILNDASGTSPVAGFLDLMSGHEAKTGSTSKVSLSVQSAVSCGFYTQGCNGGLEVLVHRFARESGIAERECMRYEGREATCKGECFSDERSLTFAKDYGYMGGLYGLCSETRIMRNLYERGPLTVAIHTKDAELGRVGSFVEEAKTGDDVVGVRLEGWPMSSVMVDLMSSERLRKYLVNTSNFGAASSEGAGSEVSADNKQGVLYVRASMVNKEWRIFQKELELSLKQNAREGVVVKEAFGVGIHTWRYIDHSVAVVGWGEDPEPHWIIRNSWAGDLPGGGYTKVRRGLNKGQVESAAVWVEPDLCRGKPREILKQAGKLNFVC